MQEKQQDLINDRKSEHLRIIRSDPSVDRQVGAFDSIELIHRGFNQGNLAKVCTASTLLGKELAMPLMIGAMTGGSGKEIGRVNRMLAHAAQKQHIAIALGSMRPLLESIDDKSVQESFSLRDIAPTIPILANIGIAQVAKGLDYALLERALQMIDADALVVHFNSLQEAIQPEGECDFTGLKQELQTLKNSLSIPLIAKEVGCGFSLEDMEELYECGISLIEVAGRGGTSWSRVEYHRRREEDDDLGLVFQDWGITTVECLMMAALSDKKFDLIASGGVRCGMDMAKAVAMGAQCTAMARPILLAADKGEEALQSFLEQRKKELKVAMFLTGVRSIDELRGARRLFRYVGGTN